MRQAKRRRRLGVVLFEKLERRRLLAVSSQWICGTIFQDASGTGEHGRAFGGITAYIDVNNDGIFNNGELSQVTDDSSGDFCFEDLPLGKYVVRHVVPPGFEFAWWHFVADQDLSSVAGQSFEFELTANRPRQHIYFTDVPFVVIDGTPSDDVITVGPDPGGVLVTVNGTPQVHGIAGIRGVLARGGEGRDTITFDQQLAVRGLIYGNPGNDALSGGAANDTIYGGLGADKIDGGDGKDLLFGNEGRNHLMGGPGNDNLVDGDYSKQSLLEGNGGNDMLSGGIIGGKATLSGGAGDDTLTGGGHVTLLGGDGNDNVAGGDGAYSSGGKGNDTIGGNEGDTMVGGAGTDVAVYFHDDVPSVMKGIEKSDIRKRHRQHCFLTSAVVYWAGKADDCHELTVLREFRDSYLWRLPQGPAMIRDYYEHAPRVVRAIEEQGRGEVEWPIVYAMVQKAVRLIEAGQNAEALAVYSAEYLRLKAEYVEAAVV